MHAARLSRIATRALAAFGVAALFVGIGAAVVTGLSGETGSSAPPPPPTTVQQPPAKPKPRKPRRAAPKRPIALAAAAAFDPEGDGRENDEEVPLAVDGRLDTFWRTERYRSFSKEGVGILLDAGRRRTISEVRITTDTPGIRAQIRLGDAPTGPLAPASAEKIVSGTTAFPLRGGRAVRYVLVWLTELPPENVGHVNEVKAR